MKVLVAYDGSTSADAAVVDMRRAGLPRDAEGLLVSVVAASGSSSTVSKIDLYEGQSLVGTVHKWIQSNFPEWKATRQVLAGSPAIAILEKASSWHPDLIVAGSHGRSLVGGILLGSVSSSVLNQAHCVLEIVQGK